ncbi:hypothetical protein ABIF76_004769 [Bradyrhizobium ottawaense]
MTSFIDTAPVALSVTAICVVIGAISSLNLPPCWAAAVRRWLSSEYSSCFSREMP